MNWIERSKTEILRNANPDHVKCADEAANATHSFPLESLHSHPRNETGGPRTTLRGVALSTSDNPLTPPRHDALHKVVNGSTVRRRRRRWSLSCRRRRWNLSGWCWRFSLWRWCLSGWCWNLRGWGRSSSLRCWSWCS